MSIRRGLTGVVTGLLVWSAALALASAAGTSVQITEFKQGMDPRANPLALARGPAGNEWFTDDGTPGAIGRVTPAGQITEFTAGVTSPQWIALGPDGNLWFTDFGPPFAIGRFSPTTHKVDEFTAGLTAKAGLDGIAAGHDGNVWFTDYGTPAIGRINPTTHKIDEFGTANGLNPGSNPRIITPGPDGNLWFTDEGTPGAIGRITPSGQITEFTTGLSPGSRPNGIVAGSDGNLWFTDEGTKAIGRINPSTQKIDEFTAGLNPGASPEYIAAGPDGHLWFTDDGSQIAIGRIDPATRKIEEFGAGLSSTSSLYGIAPGPDGNMWFADIGTEEVGRITTGVVPTMSNLRVSPRRASPSGRRVNGKCMRPTKQNAAHKHCRLPIVLHVTYTLNFSAPVTVTLKLSVPGRRVKGHCVAPTHHNHTHAMCTRMRALPGQLSLTGKPGANGFTFDGKVGGHTIGPGTYQLIATPSGGQPKTVMFQIAR